MIMWDSFDAPQTFPVFAAKEKTWYCKLLSCKTNKIFCFKNIFSYVEFLKAASTAVIVQNNMGHNFTFSAHCHEKKLLTKLTQSILVEKKCLSQKSYFNRLSIVPFTYKYSNSSGIIKIIKWIMLRKFQLPHICWC